LISAPAVQFKGSGWYVTDYAKKGSGSASSTASDGDSSSKSKETKKDDKPKSDTVSKKQKKD
jgi:predicted nucleic acid-binding Zn ribbon protein